MNTVIINQVFLFETEKTPQKRHKPSRMVSNPNQSALPASLLVNAVISRRHGEKAPPFHFSHPTPD